jgi:hypothetical protein
MNYKEIITKSIDNGSKLISNLPDEKLIFDNGRPPGCWGMSGSKGRHFLNNVVSNYTGCNYLEIGSHTGSTLCSALYNNKNINNTYSIDNFAWAKDDTSKVDATLTQLKSNIKQYIPHTVDTHKHIMADCFALDPLEQGITDIDIYFFDAGHSEEDHYKALTHYIDCMSQKFIYIVDDWVGEGGRIVRTGTINAINDLQLTARLFKEQPENYNKGVAAPTDPDEWWNGFGIFILEKPE